MRLTISLERIIGNKCKAIGAVGENTNSGEKHQLRRNLCLCSFSVSRVPLGVGYPT